MQCKMSAADVNANTTAFWIITNFSWYVIYKFVKVIWTHTCNEYRNNHSSQSSTLQY